VIEDYARNRSDKSSHKSSSGNCVDRHLQNSHEKRGDYGSTAYTIDATNDSDNKSQEEYDDW